MRHRLTFRLWLHLTFTALGKAGRTPPSVLRMLLWASSELAVTRATMGSPEMTQRLLVSVPRGERSQYHAAVPLDITFAFQLGYTTPLQLWVRPGAHRRLGRIHLDHISLVLAKSRPA